jgi:hypothetical protein
MPALTATSASLRFQPVAKAFGASEGKHADLRHADARFAGQLGDRVDEPLLVAVARLLDDVGAGAALGHPLGQEQGHHCAAHAEQAAEDQQCLQVEVDAVGGEDALEAEQVKTVPTSTSTAMLVARNSSILIIVSGSRVFPSRFLLCFYCALRGVAAVWPMLWVAVSPAAPRILSRPPLTP